MAEKKTHKIVSADSGETVKAARPKEVRPAAETPKIKQARPNGNPAGLRVGAVVLWLAAIAFEVLAVLVLFGKITMTFMPMMWQLIAFIVLDLACVIIGAQLWKKANHIDPVSEEQKDAAVEVLGDTQVYWAPFGKVYHTHEDCQALNNSETLTVGTVDQAIAANRTRLCKFCAGRDSIDGVVTTD